MRNATRDTPPTRIGVLGGMGPAATADFYRQLVATTPASHDAQHVPVLIWGDPRTPDRSDAILGHGDDPTPWLRHGAQMLKDSGASSIVVPCITSHHFVRDIADELELTLIDMVDATAAEIAAAGITRAGVLATTGTIEARLFQDALAARNIDAIIPPPSDQERVMAAIRGVKAGHIDASRPEFVETARRLEQSGAEAIVAGCTEVPLGLDGADVGIPVYDPAAIVIDHIVAEHQKTSRGEEDRTGASLD